MSTYIIGDLQGCFDSLQALIQKIHFDPRADRLGFVGDLVNRGPKSLQTLRFIQQLKEPLIVLGNHDLHLMALHFLRQTHKGQFQHISHTLQAVLEAPDCETLIEFLLQKPFIQSEKNFLLVHAGIPPQWSIEQALQYASEAEKKMQENPVTFFQNVYGNHPLVWDTNLTGWDRIRYIVNALTRMRFCDSRGTLELENKTDLSTSKQFRPWFEWITPNKIIFFGHWASLNGRCSNPRIFALDTGCAWGGTLTAIRAEDLKRVGVSACEKEY